MSSIAAVSSRHVRSFSARTLFFFAFWVILSGFKTADLVVGALAAVIATLASERLLPPGRWSFRPVALATLAMRFFYQSISAGIEVARRALDPRLPLRPGFVVYRSQLPPGPSRNAFCTMISLLPGTLPCGPDANDSLVIHCLDVNEPVLEQMAAEEARFVRALGGGHRHD